MKPQQITSLVTLAVSLSGLIAANYAAPIRDFVTAHPTLTTIAGGLIMILNNLLPPAHKP